MHERVLTHGCRTPEVCMKVSVCVCKNFCENILGTVVRKYERL